MGSGDTTVRGIEGFTTADHNAAISFALAFTVAELRRENGRLKQRVSDLQACGPSAWGRDTASEPEVYPVRPPCDPPIETVTRAEIDGLTAAIVASMPAPGTWSTISMAPAGPPTSHYPAPVVGPPPVSPSLPWPPAAYALHPPPVITDEEIAARFGIEPRHVQAAIARGMPVVGPIVASTEPPSIVASFARDDAYYSRGDTKTPETPE
jgi:hypothetical protein